MKIDWIKLNNKIDLLVINHKVLLIFSIPGSQEDKGWLCDSTNISNTVWVSQTPYKPNNPQNTEKDNNDPWRFCP